MFTHPNEKLIRHAYDLFARGDIDLLRVVLADDVVWHVPGRSALAGDYKGPDEILDLLRTLSAHTGGTFRAEICAVLNDSDRVVVLEQETAQRGDARLDVLAAIDYEIHAGRITEVTVYQGDAYEFDEFWG